MCLFSYGCGRARENDGGEKRKTPLKGGVFVGGHTSCCVGLGGYQISVFQEPSTWRFISRDSSSFL